MTIELVHTCANFILGRLLDSDDRKAPSHLPVSNILTQDIVQLNFTRIFCYSNVFIYFMCNSNFSKI